MDQIRSFAEENSLTFSDGAYVGIYADMFVALECDGEALKLHVCADLPKGAKRAQLLEALKSKEARYQAEIGPGGNENVLVFTFAGGSEAISRMERLINECDVLLRPYTREMGVLCGRCRREIHSGEPYEVQVIDGEKMPVCAACAKGESKRGENRRTVKRQRAQRGVVGALIGMLVCTAAYMLLDYLGLSGMWLPSIGMGFILNRFYQRFGGIDDKWSMYLLSICAVFSILFGMVLNAVISALVVSGQFGEYAEEAFSAADALRMAMLWLKSYLLSSTVWVYTMIPNMIAAVIGVFVFRGR